ncbi:MAG: dTDP-glucose 4,6-dehydratase [Candidatus Anstonellales archaeon]
MKILVSGGAGFIGSNFIRKVLAKHGDWEIINLDKLTYAGNLENCKDFEKNKNYSFVRGDICNFGLVKKLLKDCNIAVNFAAETHVDRSIEDPEKFVRTDVLGTQRLLEACRLLDVEKFVQISSDEVYGSIDKGVFNEDSPLLPNSPYSASKAAADMLVRAYNRTYGLFTIITRSSNNYGPYQHPEKFIPKMITNLLQRKKIPLYGSGEQIRDWIHVYDNCEAIELVIRKGKKGEIYNIGGECERRNIEVARMVAQLMGFDETWIESVADRKGHDFRYALSSEKIKKIGWRRKIGFEEGMADTVKWYEKNREWWEKLV